MITTIIFSKNRAMQLDATLRSFFLHCVDAQNSVYVHVLYLASTTRDAQQYHQLVREYPQVQFHQQVDFRKDMLEIFGLDKCSGLSFAFRPGTFIDRWVLKCFDPLRLWRARSRLSRSKDSQGILFLVDDNIFVRDFELAPALEALQSNSEALGFSLRLGRNTSYSYMADKPQPLPDFKLVANDILQFHWVDASLDFSYPLEVSSSIYFENIILPLLCIYSFRNPNELEAFISTRSGLFGSSHPKLLCFDESVTFCNPVNVVQSVYKNRTNNKHHFSIEDLMERFDRGERVDVAAYSGFTPNGCHQEIELVF
jgi:hypothetical protein